MGGGGEFREVVYRVAREPMIGETKGAMLVYSGEKGIPTPHLKRHITNTITCTLKKLSTTGGLERNNRAQRRRTFRQWPSIMRACDLSDLFFLP